MDQLTEKEDHLCSHTMLSIRSYFLILTIMVLCIPSILVAQSLDEMWQDHGSETSDSNRVKALLDIGYALEMDNPDSALAVYRMAVELGNSSNYLIGTGRALMYSGIVKSNSGDHETSIQFYEDALDVFGSIGYELGVAATHVNIGVVYNYRGEYEKAMEEYIISIRKYEELEALPQLLNCYGNVGGLFMELKQYLKGRAYFLKEMELAVELADSSMLADAYNNIAFSHQMIGNIDSAIINYNLALKIAEEHNSLYVQFLGNNNLADILAASGDVEMALPYSLKALKYAHEVGNPYNVMSAYKNLGARYLELDQFNMADIYLDSAIWLGSRISSKDMLAETYMFLAESKAKQNDHASAYDFLLLQKVYADSVFSEQKLQR